MSPIDLRLGRWQDVLADVTTCDAVICDPPYSARTHEGHDSLAGDERFSDPARTNPTERQTLDYAAWTFDDVKAFVWAWSTRCSGWIVAMTSHDLIGAWEAAYSDAGRLAFAPVPIIQKRPRLVGDGPSSWAVYMMVGRPRNKTMAAWGCLPGAYEAPTVKGSGIAGAKPIVLMRAIVRDYSRPGDLIVDPFCGSGTTALAAAMEGRRCITSEEKPEHHAIAKRRLDRGYQPGLI